MLFRVVAVLVLLGESVAFHIHQRPQICSARAQSKVKLSLSTTATEANDTISEQAPIEPKPCYYKRIDGSWKPRKQLKDLFIGERLFATRLAECDLIDGVTGPKAFVECGVGRTTDKNGQKWKIVNGMVRMGKRTGKKNRMKESVVRKRLAKMPSDELFKVYVSKINLEHDSFEVCLKRSDAMEENERPRPISASTLKPGQELSGYVRDITDYGVFIDVGANRKGLLHITKIGQYYDRFINKEEGLKKVGIKRGAPINVVVLSNQKKRLELDFPPAEEKHEEEGVSTVSHTSTTTPTGYDISEDEEAAWSAYGNNDVSAEEEAMWAAYASNYASDDDEEDVKDDYDEDRDIEDALGIGSW